MRCFASAARTLNFTQTARELFVTQPAVTQSVSATEKELGVRLFDRLGHKVALTPAGEVVAEGFESILRSYDALVARARDVQRGDAELRIGYHGPQDWGMMSRLVRRFAERCPGVVIDIRTEHWGVLVHDLACGLLDAVFTEVVEVDGHPELARLPLFLDRCCIGLAAGHPLAGRESVRAVDLEGETIIMGTSPRPSVSMDTIIARLAAIGLDMEHARYVHQFETAITLAAAGVGVTPLPRSFKMERAGLAFVDLADDAFYMNMALAYDSRAMSPQLQAFVEVCAANDWGEAVPAQSLV